MVQGSRPSGFDVLSNLHFAEREQACHLGKQPMVLMCHRSIYKQATIINGTDQNPIFHARLFSHWCLIAQYKCWECLFVQLSTKCIEKNKFIKMGNKKFRKRYFSWFCGTMQNSALVPQNSADHFGENHEILRISAEFCGIPQNVFCFTELFCGTRKRNNSLQKSAELSKSVLRNSAGVFGSAELICGTLYY